MRNKTYTLILDEHFDSSMKKLQATFHPDERVVSTNIYGNKYIVMTEIDDGRPRNLLLDQIARREVPASVFGLDTKGDDDEEV